MREELRPGDYGYRRKRNIILSSDNSGEIAAGVRWPDTSPSDDPICDEEDLKEYGDLMECDIEEYEEDQDTETGKDIEPLMIGIKPINLDKFKIKKDPQPVEKVTIYLDKNLMSVLKILKRNKSITSYSQCIAEALEQYLTT